jgi:hypothetical protein
MTLRVESERWCESAINPSNTFGHSCCGDVATSVCEGCGLALCESHEVVCRSCLGVNCGNCMHTCRLTPPTALTTAA